MLGFFDVTVIHFAWRLVRRIRGRGRYEVCKSLGEAGLWSSWMRDPFNLAIGVGWIGWLSGSAM